LAVNEVRQNWAHQCLEVGNGHERIVPAVEPLASRISRLKAFPNYRVMATSLGFEGHMSMADAMT
jgi:hypothetical protein